MHSILVVEDNEDLRSLVRDTLRDAGFAAEMAADGAHGLEVLATMTVAPCVILSDLAMPNMDGRQFLAALGADHRWAGIPFLVMTASREPLGLGKTRILLKPLGLRALFEALEEMCTSFHPLAA
jgi:CheY-like chemotaxis protein